MSPRSVIAALCLLVALFLPGSAAARRQPLARVIQDDATFLNPQKAGPALDLAVSLGFTNLRVTASWDTLTRSSASGQKPNGFDSADPAAYEQARFTGLDNAVRQASARGLRPMIDIAFWAPYWATTDKPGSQGERARTRISPQEFAAFAAAIARRYSGSFTPAGADSPLPAVGIFTLWNEPNIPGFLMPQWQPDGQGNRVPASPAAYRALVAAAYPQIKALRPDTTVLVGALAGVGNYDESRTDGGIPPLAFLRALACVDKQLRSLKTTSCENFQMLPGDGYSHHPYAFGARPDEPSARSRPDNARLGDMRRLERLINTLVARGRLAPGWKRIWITEYGYQTGGVQSKRRLVSTAQQALYTPWSEYLAWRDPQIVSFAQFLLYDISGAGCESYPPGMGACLAWATGLFDIFGRPKPALEAFRAGLFARRTRRRELQLWGRLAAPLARCPARVEYLRAGRWTPLPARLGSLKSAGGGVLLGSARLGRVSGLRLGYNCGSGWLAGPGVSAQRDYREALPRKRRRARKR